MPDPAQALVEAMTRLHLGQQVVVVEMSAQRRAWVRQVYQQAIPGESSAGVVSDQGFR